jgi:phosphate transport system substrate-binding protein
VSSFIGKTDGSIGYVEMSFAQVNNLKTVKIFNGAGEFTALSAQAAGKTVASAQTGGATANDLKLTIDYNTTASGAYPIVLVTYEIVCEKGTSATALPLLKSFLTYTSSSAGQQSLTAIGYAPLPDNVRTKVATAVAALS